MLTGKRVYVVEDEAIVALEMQQVLEDAGATVRTFPNATDAGLDENVVAADLVLFDARLGAPQVVAFASRLRQAGVPMVVASADTGVGTLFPDAVTLSKPFMAQTLIEACLAAITVRAPVTQYEARS